MLFIQRLDAVWSDAAGKMIGGILGVSNIIIKMYKTKNGIT